MYQPTRHEQQLKKLLINPIELPSALQPYTWNSKVMFPRYLFDHPQSIKFRNLFMKWWQQYYPFPGSSVYDVGVRLVAQRQRASEGFFHSEDITKTSIEDDGGMMVMNDDLSNTRETSQDVFTILNFSISFELRTILRGFRFTFTFHSRSVIIQTFLVELLHSSLILRQCLITSSQFTDPDDVLSLTIFFTWLQSTRTSTTPT